MRYFAYGENMSRVDFAAWCMIKDRRVLDLRERNPQPAVLNDYKLVFNHYSRSRDCGIANLQASTGSKVEGVLYDVSASDLDVLDIKAHHPEIFTRRPVTVRLNGDEQEAFTYIANGAVIREAEVPTSRDYRNVLLEGARENGLSKDWISGLEKILVKKD